MWDGDPSQVQRQFIDRTGTTYPLLLHASKIGRQYGLGKTSYVVLDHEGVVRYITNQTVQLGPSYAESSTSPSKPSRSRRILVKVPQPPIDEQESLPEHFALLASYPNPFNCRNQYRFPPWGGDGSDHNHLRCRRSLRAPAHRRSIRSRHVRIDLGWKGRRRPPGFFRCLFLSFEQRQAIARRARWSFCVSAPQHVLHACCKVPCRRRND